MYFPSKTDFWSTIIIRGVISFTLFLFGTVFITSKSLSGILGAGLFLLLFGLAFWVEFSTGYLLNAEELIVRCGPFRHKIDLGTIKKVRRTNDIAAAPALSVDRLAIHYGNGEYALISPTDAEKFICELQERCPNADIKYTL